MLAEDRNTDNMALAYKQHYANLKFHRGYNEPEKTGEEVLYSLTHALAYSLTHSLTHSFRDIKLNEKTNTRGSWRLWTPPGCP